MEPGTGLSRVDHVARMVRAEQERQLQVHAAHKVMLLESRPPRDEVHAGRPAKPPTEGHRHRAKPEAPKKHGLEDHPKEETSPPVFDGERLDETAYDEERVSRNDTSQPDGGGEPSDSDDAPGRPPMPTRASIHVLAREQQRSKTKPTAANTKKPVRTIIPICRAYPPRRGEEVQVEEKDTSPFASPSSAISSSSESEGSSSSFENSDLDDASQPMVEPLALDCPQVCKQYVEVTGIHNATENEDTNPRISITTANIGAPIKKAAPERRARKDLKRYLRTTSPSFSRRPDRMKPGSSPSSVVPSLASTDRFTQISRTPSATSSSEEVEKQRGRSESEPAGDETEECSKRFGDPSLTATCSTKSTDDRYSGIRHGSFGVPRGRQKTRKSSQVTVEKKKSTAKKKTIEPQQSSPNSDGDSGMDADEDDDCSDSTGNERQVGPASDQSVDESSTVAGSACASTPASIQSCQSIEETCSPMLCPISSATPSRPPVGVHIPRLPLEKMAPLNAQTVYRAKICKQLMMNNNRAAALNMRKPVLKKATQPRWKGGGYEGYGSKPRKQCSDNRKIVKFDLTDLHKMKMFPDLETLCQQMKKDLKPVEKAPLLAREFGEGSGSGLLLPRRVRNESQSKYCRGRTGRGSVKRTYAAAAKYGRGRVVQAVMVGLPHVESNKEVARFLVETILNPNDIVVCTVAFEITRPDRIYGVSPVWLEKATEKQNALEWMQAIEVIAYLSDNEFRHFAFIPHPMPVEKGESASSVATMVCQSVDVVKPDFVAIAQKGMIGYPRLFNHTTTSQYILERCSRSVLSVGAGTHQNT
eukprot:GHVN01000735.1.p1 GENE.GHVN01000735.1~~GHVN01000735.1.p1  ORF type:complete len:815 (-),score=121.11 GHVN01000735.1:6513-8957(-)